MFHDMKRHIKDPNDEDEIRDYLVKLLHKEAFDKRGLIYGMGHAVYSISDPRAQIFKKFVKRLAEEKGRNGIMSFMPRSRDWHRKLSQKNGGSTKA